MTLDTSGFLLEGVRVASGNSPLTFPPRSVVVDAGALGASPGRAEYALFVSGQSPGKSGMDVGDPALRVLWTRNDSVTRFDYDAFSRRWDPLPGGPPERIGLLSNSLRLRAPVPVSGTPYSLYVGSPTRVRTFSVSVVDSESGFGSPPGGTVEIASDGGLLNFSASDLADPTVSGKPVLLCRQSFYSRQSQQPIGSTDSTELFLNPIPGAGQSPRVRIGFGRHLASVAVPSESSLYDPPSGTAVYSLDTGAVRISRADASSRPSTPVWYDGVTLGTIPLTRGIVGTVSSTSVGSIPGAAPVTDPSRYVLFAETVSGRHYLAVRLDGQPSQGWAAVNPSTGAVTVSSEDASALGGLTLLYVDTYLIVERGVAVQLMRSAVNGPGLSRGSDFVEFYDVRDQLLQDGLSGSPMIPLTAVPVDGPSLRVRVAQGDGSGGSYVGDLLHVRDAGPAGPRYYLDHQTKSVRTAVRRSLDLVLSAAATAVKLPDAAIVPDGLSVVRDGVELSSGSSFSFDSVTGVMEFLKPVGEGDDGCRTVSGSVTQSGSLLSPGAFSGSDIGRYVLDDRGFHRIIELTSPDEVRCDPALASTGPVSVSVKSSREVVADRFWSPVEHRFKKLTVEVLDGTDDAIPTALAESQYSVIPGSGQVSLVSPALPGQVFRVTYRSLEDDGDGLPARSVERGEFAGFKVRQEIASSAGGSTVAFNPSGKTVIPSRGMTVTVDGVTADPSSYSFTAPGTISLGGPPSGEVVVDYWVAEAPGGNQSFKVEHYPMDVDVLTVSGRDSSDDPVTLLNGDQTASVPPGGAVLADGKSVYLVRASEYDPSRDVTEVRFLNPPSSSYPAQLSSCARILDSFVQEDGIADPVPRGTNVLSISGRRPYRAGTVVTLDGLPYLAISSEYRSGKTVVTLATSAVQNHVLPEVRRTLRPVFHPGTAFDTAIPVHPGLPLTVVRGGSRSAVLTRGTDYTVSDGGQVLVSAPLGFGDTLEVSYVGRDAQPAGTRITGGYSAAAVPDSVNGLAGQKLYLSYTLQSPDTFFYRVESVSTMVPEIVQALSQSSSASTGPNVAGRSSPKAKDMGVKSPWFDEQHEANVDTVARRLLKLYHDLIERHEDVLAGMDGRVVGSTSGRFRYDALAGGRRASYAEVTNDIDDTVKAYDRVVMSGFLSFSEEPVYSRMCDPGPLSRLFPTRRGVTVALNGRTGHSNFGATLGSIGVEGLTSVSSMTQSSSPIPFVATGASTVRLSWNGGTSPPSPRLTVGTPLKVFSADGTPSGTSSVLSVSDNGDGTWSATLSSVPVRRGSVARDVSVGDPKVYSPGRDLTVDMDSGQVKNASLPSLFASTQVEVDGNELVDAEVSFNHPSTSPVRFPALDGSTLDDSGRHGTALLSYYGEVQALEDELDLLSLVAEGSLLGDFITIQNADGFPAGSVSVGSTVRFVDGPNRGLDRTVASVTASQVVLSSPLSYSTGVTKHTFAQVVDGRTAASAASDLASILDSQAPAAAAPPAAIGRVGSQSSSIGLAVRAAGSVVASLIASTSAGSRTVSVAGLPGTVRKGNVLYIESGPGRGVYMIEAVGPGSVTVSGSSPFSTPSGTGPGPCSIVALHPFIGTSHVGALSRCLRALAAFRSDTDAWSASFSYSGVPSRRARVTARIGEIKALTSLISSALGTGDGLYDARFLWIGQRVDRKDGCLARYLRAVSDRQAALLRIASDQAKLLVAGQLA